MMHAFIHKITYRIGFVFDYMIGFVKGLYNALINSPPTD